MLLYHYCSNATFLSILTNRELWLSELTLSNDSMEGAWVREVLLSECRRREMPRQAMDDFTEKVGNLLHFASAAGFCLSQDGDLLSQWRGYADNGAGVCLGFDQERLPDICSHPKSDEFGVTVQQVHYEPEAQRALVAPHVDTLSDLVEKGALAAHSSVLSLLNFDLLITEEQKKERTALSWKYNFSFLLMLDLLFTLKNPAFAEEQEWRLVSILLKSGKNHSLEDRSYSNAADLDFRSCGDRIVPYLKLPLPGDKLSCIREVILGPRNHTPEAVIRAFLTKVGLPDVIIKRSAATYR